MQSVKLSRGITLIELVVGTAVFLIVALAVYQGYGGALSLAQAAKSRSLALLVANEELEIVRNMPYGQVGLEGGVPAGILPRWKTVSRGSGSFVIELSIRNVDDPFDGTIGGTPNDLSPADYKLVEVAVGCVTCAAPATTTITGTVAPKSLESSTGNGALFVTVINANGVPVPQASVHIVNNSLTPALDISEQTNNSGSFQLVDAPPAVQSYQVIVTKAGYTSASTSDPLDPNNPNPVAPHATVAAGQVTALTFVIDETSTLTLKTVRENCSAVPNTSVRVRGAKLIGTDPELTKYDVVHTTDANGEKTINTMEWDSYSLSLSGGTNDLAGTLPLSPFALNPGSSQDAYLVLQSDDPQALLVTVKDAVTGLPLSDAVVELTLGGVSETKTTNRGFFTQTDWSGGGGQELWSDATRYKNGTDVDTTSVPGTIQLASLLGTFSPAGTLESSIFDTGATTTSYYQLSWLPESQMASTGPMSVRFQIAASNSTSTSWDYLGPDGTTGSYYTLTNTNLAAALNDKRYIRYKLFLSTEDTTVSPSISDVSLTYSSACIPFGQVLFGGLSNGTYQLKVNRSGYQEYVNDLVLVAGSWQYTIVSLSPQ